MKKLVLITLTFISINCFSQAREPYVPGTSSPASAGWINHTPGLELQKAGISFYTGLALETGGVILISVGSVQQALAGGGSSGSGEITFGVIALATGGVFQALSWVHIIRAGRIMDARKISFGPTSNGLGLICKL